MKKKEKQELKAKTINELNSLLKEMGALIFKQRIEKSQNKLKNIRSIFIGRKKMAFVLTIINEKKVGEKLAAKKRVLENPAKKEVKKKTTKGSEK